MKAASLLFAAALAVAPVITLAQDSHEPPTAAQMAAHEVRRYSALLTLTAPQQEAALTIFTTEATASIALRTTEHTDRDALEAAIVANNTATIAQLSTALGELSGETILARSNAGAAFYKLLTPEQQTKLTDLHRAHALGGERGGPQMHE